MKKLIMILIANLVIATTSQAATVMIVNRGASKVSCAGECAKFPKTIESHSAPSVKLAEDNWSVEYRDARRRGCVFKQVSSPGSSFIQAIQLSGSSLCSVESASADDVVLVINAAAYGK